MTLQEMNLAVFRRQPLPHVFFQPRFEPWVNWKRLSGDLPEELRDLSLLEIYDRVGASMRYVHYGTGQPSPTVVRWGPEVRVHRKEEGELAYLRYETPKGDLTRTEHLTSDRAWWQTIEFLAKGPADLPALRWLIEHQEISFSAENYRKGKAYVGDRGEGTFWVPKSPYLALAQGWMKYEDFIYALADCPREIEEIMKVIDESYDAFFEQLAHCPDLKMVNFGENIASAYLSPRYYEQYLLPWYVKRSGQLRKAGVFTFVHIDGNFHELLPYLADMPFDGLEALTPRPQGDVTLEEIREHIGDKVLLDGIPAVYFLDHHSREELAACAEKVVRLFHPRLILGISDELPQGGGAEAYARLKWLADWCRGQS
jgi:hypothetical protein